MYRKLTSLLLSSALVMGGMGNSIITVFAESTQSSTQDASSTLITFLSATGTSSLSLQTGTYKYAQSMIVTGNKTLDLNGQTLEMTDSSIGTLITVSSGSSLTLINSASTLAQLTGANNAAYQGLICVEPGGSLTVDGNILINVSTTTGNIGAITVAGSDNSSGAGGVLNFKAGTISASGEGSRGIYIRNNPVSYANQSYNCNVSIFGGSITAARYAIQNNGFMRNTRLTISGGTITGGTAGSGIYFGGSGNATISGTPTITGGTALLNGSGTIGISGGTFKATGTAPGDYGGSEAMTPGAVVVQDHDGGNYSSNPASVTITGGTFTGSSTYPAVSVQNFNNTIVSSSTAPGAGGVISISGGTYSTDPSQVGASKNISYVSTRGGVASVTNNGTITFYSDYNTAVSANPGKTITVYGTSGSCANSVTLTFNYKNGTNGSQIFTIPSGQAFVIPTLNISYSGYTFKGWQTTEGTIYQTGASISPTSDTTFNAVWSKNEAPIDPNYVPNSGTNAGVTNTGPGFTANGSTTLTNSLNNTQTTYTQNANGTKAATTQNSAGTILGSVLTVPSSSIVNGQVTISLGMNSITRQNLIIEGNKTNEGTAPELNIKLPSSSISAKINIPIANGTMTPGTVALVQNALKEWVPISKTTVDGNILSIPITGSTEIIIMNNAAPFSDEYGIPSYATQAAAYMSARDLMTGMGTVNPKPFDFNGNLSRGQFAVILYRLAGSPAGSGSYPAGIIPGAWNANAARWAVQSGLMAQGSQFSPQGSVSRQQLIAILYRLQGAPTISTSVLNNYVDADQIYPANFRPAMAWGISLGIIGQDSSKRLNPTGEASRAEIAAMMERYLNTVY